MKRKGRDPRFKLQRRLLTELPGLGKAGALERKPYPPGQHGARRIKYSDHRLQLEEKQKVRIHYNLREEQLLRLVKKAKKSRNEKWINSLINILEKRLENIVFRGALAPSMMSAAQMISHGQVFVNDKRVDIRSAELRVGDRVSLTPKGIKNQLYLQAKAAPRLPLPDWIRKTESDEAVTLTLAEEPTLEAVPFAFNDSLVTSFYSKV